MLKNRLFQDIAVGGGLLVALLLIFFIDRLVSTPLPDASTPGVSVVRQSGTLLGDHNIVVRLKALGSVERLEKLQVVRLTAKASFARATNINDITLTWCWEPKITMRFVETRPDSSVQVLANFLEQAGEAGREKFLVAMKKDLDLPGNLADELDREVHDLFRARDYKPILDSVILLDDQGAFQVFSSRLILPIKPARAVQMKNLCFALSVSNLLPIQRHKFQVQPGANEMVKGRLCDQFTVHHPDGLKLQFFFDRETNLLAKIAHMGHDPNAQRGTEKQVLWEHYFSDYRETEGIKQWRRAEVDNDGERFATLNVTGVEFFNEMRPELQRRRQ